VIWFCLLQFSFIQLPKVKATDDEAERTNLFVLAGWRVLQDDLQKAVYCARVMAIKNPDSKKWASQAEPTRGNQVRWSNVLRCVVNGLLHGRAQRCKVHYYFVGSVVSSGEFSHYESFSAKRGGKSIGF
jgi:hypothetical protein